MSHTQQRYPLRTYTHQDAPKVRLYRPASVFEARLRRRVRIPWPSWVHWHFKRACLDLGNVCDGHRSLYRIGGGVSLSLHHYGGEITSIVVEVGTYPVEWRRIAFPEDVARDLDPHRKGVRLAGAVPQPCLGFPGVQADHDGVRVQLAPDVRPVSRRVRMSLQRTQLVCVWTLTQEGTGSSSRPWWRRARVSTHRRERSLRQFRW